MKEDIFEIIKFRVKPTQFARIVLGEPNKKSGDTLFYYSPLRIKERTPSLAVNNKKGITDFGIGKNYDIISFVSEYENCSLKKACYRIAEIIGINLFDFEREINNNTFLKNKFQEEIKIQIKINEWFDNMYDVLTSIYKQWHDLICVLPSNSKLLPFVYEKEQYFGYLVDIFFFADSEDKINLYKSRKRFEKYERKGNIL